MPYSFFYLGGHRMKYDLVNAIPVWALDVVNKIKEMGNFCDIYNCGCPTKALPANICFELDEGYRFYVVSLLDMWSIYYTFDTSITEKADMQHIHGIKDDQDMLKKVEEVIKTIREKEKEEWKGKEAGKKYHIDILA